jgi:hypothetical protein
MIPLANFNHAEGNCKTIFFLAIIKDNEYFSTAVLNLRKATSKKWIKFVYRGNPK